MTGRADTLRAIPLERVAAALGYRRDRLDRAKWKRAGSVVSIAGAQFYDHLQGRGGGGAIDLVIHAEGCGFRAALDRLAPLAPGGGPETGGWPAVRAWLTGKRGLDPSLVDDCRRLGILGADRRGNAAFACRDAGGRRTGAEIRGIRPGRPFRGMERGSRKAAGGFWVARPEGARRVLLVESAVDALSALSVAELGDAGIAVSTAGVAARVPPWIEGLGPEDILCGYDADEAGDAAAAALARADRRVRRIRPDGAKDWNELLKTRSGGGPG